MNVPNSDSISKGATTTPQGCEPTETIVPLTKSTYLNNFEYSFLKTSSFSSTLLHISPTSSNDISKYLATSRMAPFNAMVLNVIMSQQYKPVLENI